MKLFQYWDTGDPPAEVAEWVTGLRDRNPDMGHRLYDRDSAGWFITKHFGARERAAFDLCAVPAMQADYFRLCALVAMRGFWVDVDCGPGTPLRTLISRAPRLLLTTLKGHIENSVIMVRRPQNPFLRACLRLATENIEERRFLDLPASIAIQLIGGPRMITNVWEAAVRDPEADPEVAAAIAEATLIPLLGTQGWLTPVAADYKETPRHWLNWEGPLYWERSP